jgi:hypothetical protein
MDTIIKTGLMAAQSVIAALEGRVPPNAVNADEVMTVLRDRQGKNR